MLSAAVVGCLAKGEVGLCFALARFVHLSVLAVRRVRAERWLLQLMTGVGFSARHGVGDGACCGLGIGVVGVVGMPAVVLE